MGAVPPRLLLLSTYYAPVVGGSETHARQIASYLTRRGWAVTVLTKRVGRDVARVDVVDGVAVHRLPPSGPRTGVQKWLMLPAVFWAMWRRRAEFDVVYSPDYRGIGVAGILAARRLGRPAVMGTAALGVISAANLDPLLARCGLNPQGLVARLVKWPLRTIYTKADAYPAITHAIAREAREAGIPETRVHYLPNSVDTTRFRPPRAGERDEIRAADGWPADRVICLFLARLSREKGLMDLLTAWSDDWSADAVLYIAGPDMTGHAFDVGPAARDFVAARNLTGRVRFVGPTAQPERLLRAADVLVQPSHWEAAPFGVIEAMATGLPIVATRVGGMGEYLEDEVNALLCEPGAPTQLGRQLARAIGDAGLRQRLGAAARQTAEREFDEAVVCDRYARLFLSLARPGATSTAPAAPAGSGDRRRS